MEDKLEYLRELTENSILFTAVAGWLAAQVLKVVFVFISDKRIDFKRLTGSGGMPSSHSSLVMALTMSVGFVDGFNSTMFAMCMVMSLIVMYDAAGVRRSAGQQAAILNKLVEDWERADYSHTEKKLKELLGHTPIEVFAGAILGIIIAIVVYA